MKKSELLRTLQTEIRRHSFDTFLTETPSMADGGPGVVVPGCSACRKNLELHGNMLVSDKDRQALPRQPKASNRGYKLVAY
jgi:hypothetical protein